MVLIRHLLQPRFDRSQLANDQLIQVSDFNHICQARFCYNLYMIERAISSPASRALDTFEPREPLPETLIEEYLRLFGKHEAQAIALLALPGPDEMPISKRVAKSMINSLQEPDVTWPANKRNLERFFRRLESAGLVEADSTRYKRTRSAEELAVPFIKTLLIDISAQHEEISLQGLWGKGTLPVRHTSDGPVQASVSSPVNRLHIFKALIIGGEPSTAVDIVYKTGIQSQVVGKHLRDLSDHGLVTYDYTTRATREALKHYRLAENLPETEPQLPSYNHAKRITKRAFELIRNDPTRWFSIEELARKIQTEGISSMSPEIIAQHLRTAFGHLYDDGYLIKTRVDPDLGATVSLTPPQRAFIENLLNLLDNFRNADTQTLDQMREEAHTILENQAVVSMLLAKARRDSPHASPRLRPEIKQSILSSLNKSRAMTAREIQAELRKKNVRLTLNTIRQYMNDLDEEVEYEYTKVERRRVKKWSRKIA